LHRPFLARSCRASISVPCRSSHSNQGCVTFVYTYSVLTRTGRAHARGLPTCRRAPPILSCVSWWLIPTGATKPRTCTLWLGCPNLRRDALNIPSAVDEPGSLVDLSSDFVHAGTTFKSHYNINFTLLEAPDRAYDDRGHDVLKCARSERLARDTIFACADANMRYKSQKRQLEQIPT
jgi:hypothetical protein